MNSSPPKYSQQVQNLKQRSASVNAQTGAKLVQAASNKSYASSIKKQKKPLVDIIHTFQFVRVDKQGIAPVAPNRNSAAVPSNFSLKQNLNLSIQTSPMAAHSPRKLKRTSVAAHVNNNNQDRRPLSPVNHQYRCASPVGAAHQYSKRSTVTLHDILADIQSHQTRMQQLELQAKEEIKLSQQEENDEENEQLAKRLANLKFEGAEEAPSFLPLVSGNSPQQRNSPQHFSQRQNAVNNHLNSNEMESFEERLARVNLLEEEDSSSPNENSGDVFHVGSLDSPFKVQATLLQQAAAAEEEVEVAAAPIIKDSQEEDSDDSTTLLAPSYNFPSRIHARSVNNSEDFDSKTVYSVDSCNNSPTRLSSMENPFDMGSSTKLVAAPALGLTSPLVEALHHESVEKKLQKCAKVSEVAQNLAAITEQLYKDIEYRNEQSAILTIRQYLAQQHSNSSNNNNNTNLDTIFIDATSSKCTLMHKAARYSCIVLMKFLYDNSASIESLDSLEATPLFYAANNGSKDAVQFLLDKGANVNIRDVYENTPLVLALKRKEFEIASMLLTAGADVNFKSQQGNTPVMIAVADGDYARTKFLVENGASLSRTNRFSQCCLFAAAKRLNIFVYLVDYLAKTNRPLLSKLILKHDDRGQTLLHFLIENDYFTCILYVFQVLLASEKNEMQGKHANNQSNDLTCSKLAASLVHEKDTHAGNSLLHTAVKYARIEFVKMFCMCTEVNVNATNNAGDTPLHLAVSLTSPTSDDVKMRIIRILLLSDANPRLKNGSKLSAKRLAKQSFNLDLKACLKQQVFASSRASDDVNSLSSSSASSSCSKDSPYNGENEPPSAASDSNQKGFWSRLSVNLKKKFQPLTPTKSAGKHLQQQHDRRHSMVAAIPEQQLQAPLHRISRREAQPPSMGVAPPINPVYDDLRRQLEAKRRMVASPAFK